MEESLLFLFNFSLSIHKIDNLSFPSYFRKSCTSHIDETALATMKLTKLQ
jgi:hypothetical protein